MSPNPLYFRAICTVCTGIIGLHLATPFMEMALEIARNHNDEYHLGNNICRLIECHPEHIEPYTVSVSGIGISTGTIDFN